MTKQDMSVFGLNDDGYGIEFSKFVTAVYMLVALRGPLSVRQVAKIFNVTDDVAIAAANDAYWLFIGPGDNPTTQMIEVDGK